MHLNSWNVLKRLNYGSHDTHDLYAPDVILNWTQTASVREVNMWLKGSLHLLCILRSCGAHRRDLLQPQSRQLRVCDKTISTSQGVIFRCRVFLLLVILGQSLKGASFDKSIAESPVQWYDLAYNSHGSIMKQSSILYQSSLECAKGIGLSVARHTNTHTPTGREIY